MNRRGFLVMIGGAAVAWRTAAATESVRTIAVFHAGLENDPLIQTGLVVFRRTLAELSWRDGDNLKFIMRWGIEDDEQGRAQARELVDLKPDVIIAFGPSLPPAREATRTIPIVFLGVADPVGQGFVSTLAHPGGNITGFEMLEFSAGGKFVELLKAAAPKTERVLVLLHPDYTPTPQWWRSIEGAARDVGITPERALTRSEGEINDAIAGHARAPNGSIIVSPEGFFINRRLQIIADAAQARLPAVYWQPVFVRDGGLLSYGADVFDQWAGAASYVDRILKGEKPGELPVQAPVKFQTLINLKTARDLGLTIPPTLLARADEVIE